MKNFKLIQFIKKTNLENSFLIGYYGGANFGDELLLEVFLNIFKNEKIKNIKVYYKHPLLYKKYHNNFDYDIIDAKSPIKLVQSFIFSKKIIVGGGGHWGLDFNTRIFILSLLLIFCRYILRKKIYLLGIGSYKSTSLAGRISSIFAAFAANTIFVRDKESYDNLHKWNSNIILDFDVAFLIPHIALNHYSLGINSLANRFPTKSPFIFITLRRFRNKYKITFQNIIKEIVIRNPKKSFIITTFESNTTEIEYYQEVYNSFKTISNAKVIDFNFNPIALFFYLQSNRERIISITPQFHGQIVNYLAGVTFFPLSYDNKNIELFKIMGIKKYTSIGKVSVEDIQTFINVAKPSSNFGTGRRLRCYF